MEILSSRMTITLNSLNIHKKLYKIMKTSIFILLFTSFFALSGKSFAQTAKEVDQKREQRNYFRRTLQLDSVKAEQVVQIQADYKKGLAIIVADSGLTDAGRRAKIDFLINEKNRKLKGMLNIQQQQKAIPTSEREIPKVMKQP